MFDRVIVILDYAAGNTTSIKNAIDAIGGRSELSGDPDVVRKASHLIIPGVGAFSHAINSLKKQHLDLAILELVKKEIPILGICLGYQLMQEMSYEHGLNEGLKLLPGKVKLIKTEEKPVPHIGWSEIRLSDSLSNHPFMKGIKGEKYYFIHSYGVQYEKQFDKSGFSAYGGYRFSSITLSDNIVGVQFHPEKSAINGLKMLENFKKM